ncbi:MAG: M24 family metallopeptidase [Gemmatimonadetes bacterium]|nr:M24 family metallopeptidase [Gemmatimonadota bacterium]
MRSRARLMPSPAPCARSIGASRAASAPSMGSSAGRLTVFTLLLGALACSDSPAGPGPADSACQRVANDLLDHPPPALLLAARRTALARSIGSGVVLLAADAPNADPQNSGYRGDSNLFYLAGIDVPGSWLMLVVRGGQVDSAVLFLPEPATSPTAPVRVTEVTGADRVRCVAMLGASARRQLPAAGLPLHLHSQNPAFTDTLVQALKAAPGVEVRELSGPLAALRLVKDSAEIARLTRASDITARAIVDAVAVIRPGRSEADVANAILAGYATRGAPRASFPSIVASAGNALTLHYNANGRTFTGGELVLMDVGAEFGRYAGDVTRTFPVNGKFSDRQRALYELVLGAHQAAIAAVRPGVTLAQLEQTSREYLATRSGILCGSRTCDQYFVHLLSHWLGLNVHDVGSRTTPLAAGMVLTIEPGIYLPADSIGIRIEDDVLVTASGGLVLSAVAPRTVTDIAALFAARAQTGGGFTGSPAGLRADRRK